MASKRITAKAETPPEGLIYRREFLSEDEERALLAEIERHAFQEVKMRGQVARRTVLHFGWDYDYDGWKIFPTDPPPPLLRQLADRAAHAAAIPPESLEQFLVMRYPAGAAIGWHRDAPMFGTPVIGVSILYPCAMKFRRAKGDGFEQFVQLLEPPLALHPRRRRPQRMAAFDPAGQKPAILDHDADSAQAGCVIVANRRSALPPGPDCLMSAGQAGMSVPTMASPGPRRAPHPSS